MEKISLLHKKELQEALEKVIDYVISTDSIAIEHYINKLYEQNSGITCDELAKKVLSRKSIKSGLIGAITGKSVIPQVYKKWIDWCYYRAWRHYYITYNNSY